MTEFGEIEKTQVEQKTYEETQIEWRIHDFVSDVESVKTVYSPEFSAGDDSSFYFLLCPNTSFDPEFMSLCLMRPDRREYAVEFKFGLKRSFGGVLNFVQGILLGDRTISDWIRIIRLSELLSKKSELVPGNVLTVTCTLRREITHSILPIGSSETKSLKSISKRKLEKDYEELLLSGENSDVTLVVKGKKIECHRSILAARSSVFSAMFKHGMKEKLSGVVNIQDADPTIFQEFLHYLYTGSEEHLNWENNVTELYRLADRYAMEELKDMSVHYMKNNISTKNVLAIFHLTQQHDEPELSEKTIPFFLKNSKNIIESSEWLTFLCENPIECNVLFKALANK